MSTSTPTPTDSDLLTTDTDAQLVKSASKIQSLVRGNSSRRRSATPRPTTPPESPRQPSFEETNAVSLLQSRQRGITSRRRVDAIKLKKQSASKLQSIQRGRVSRRDVRGLKDGGLDLEVMDIKKGLSLLGRNPFTLRHSFTKLTLENCNLKKIDAIANYPNLQIVELSFNRITDITCLAKLPHLLTLDLSNNSLTSILSYTIPHCTSSDSWALGNNKVGSVIADVDFSFNDIHIINDLSLHRFIHTLTLNNNHIQKIDGLNELHMLLHLDLSYNSICEIEGLDGLPLISLDLSHNNINSIKTLDKLKNLERIYLESNSISNMNGLKECYNLIEINLSDNKIETIRQVEYLTDVKRLSLLRLQGNACSSYEFYRLRVASRMLCLTVLDDLKVTAEEKVKGLNLYGGAGSDLEARKGTWNVGFENVDFVDFLKPFDEMENDPRFDDEGRGEIVRGVIDDVVNGVSISSN